MGRRNAAWHVVIGAASHEEEIGRGQHRHRNAGFGEPRGRYVEALRRQGRKLGDMADRDAPGPAAPLGLAAHLVEVERRGVEREVEVQVDVEVALLGEIEDTRDLTVTVAIDVGSTPDEIGAEVEGLDQDGVAPWIVE